MKKLVVCVNFFAQASFRVAQVAKYIKKGDKINKLSL